MATKKSSNRRPDSSRSPKGKTTSVSLSQHAEVVKDNSHLKKTIDILKAENLTMKHKLDRVIERLVSYVDEDDYDFSSCVSYLDISLEDMLAMISDITSTKDSNRQEHYLETRIEEVETRITQISTEFAKLVQLKLRMENGLNEIKGCQRIDEIKQIAASLSYDSARTQIFIQPIAEKPKKPKNKMKLLSDEVQGENIQIQIPTSDSRPTSANGIPMSVACNLEVVEIPDADVKLPGDTHIKDMIPELKQLIIQELSLYKGNGADWRMFAERVGIPNQLIDQWKIMKISQPMKNVLFVWSDSPGATVRLLHRHLVSPQLKCILLAKRITNYYTVD
ncbi:hypothetical protein SNE40_009380 [Patella caerulea]|uniref:Death domain-containing protein n=1 Tax=Patella caerulea TaxID=87958 RepID=A0AAN8JXQ1_PATCE